MIANLSLVPPCAPVASEVTEIKKAVEGLQAALEDIRSNADPARVRGTGAGSGVV